MLKLLRSHFGIPPLPYLDSKDMYKTHENITESGAALHRLSLYVLSHKMILKAMNYN